MSIMSFTLLLGIFGVSYIPTQAQNTSLTLREAAGQQGLAIGAAVDMPPFRNDPVYRETLVREFNMLVAENAMKFSPLHPAPDQFNFADADTLVNFAQANGMAVRGHTLLWYKSEPSWLVNGNYNRDQMIAILENHIKTVVGRYRGRVAHWDVVNEAIASNGSYRDTLLLRVIGPEYIEMAFRWAHEADPSARLYYNDNSEDLSPKSNGIYALMQDLLSKGVPVHGVGLQMHIPLVRNYNLDNVRANVDRLNALGLDVQITEMDVSINNYNGTIEQALQAQGQFYSNVMQLCMDAASCSALVTWGVSDRYTWLGSNNAPLLFDIAYQSKPAYHELKARLTADLPQGGTPEPTPEPSPIPDPVNPAVRVDVNPKSAGVGENVDVTLRLFNIADVYGLQSRCTVDPAVLVGSGRSDGDGFNAGNSFIVDNGYNNGDGSWLIAASRLQPNPPIVGNSTAFTLSYTVQQIGSSAIQCEILAVNNDGSQVPLEIINGVYNRDALPDVVPPTQEPEVTPEATPIASETPPAILSVVSGTMAYQNAPDNAGITIRLMGVESLMAELVTNPNGAFSFTDVPMGAYQLEAVAPQHLRTIQNVLIEADGQMIDLGRDMLPAGDTDNNGAIDILDATFIGANFGINTPPAPLNADLNRDNQINIRDLVLIGSNFGLMGPITRD